MALEKYAKYRVNGLLTLPLSDTRKKNERIYTQWNIDRIKRKNNRLIVISPNGRKSFMCVRAVLNEITKCDVKRNDYKVTVSHNTLNDDDDNDETIERSKPTKQKEYIHNYVYKMTRDNTENHIRKAQTLTNETSDTLQCNLL